ncbi:AAA family ATPase [Paenibacillus sp. BK720]|uniref:AAA family ATPase n=1 Tax=Paenibacillus sp. BK720 TaxID=2587092 RepID=UPI001FBADE7B|nr:AAA family ATPase [Paenibacillus sp. BK720]
MKKQLCYECVKYGGGDYMHTTRKTVTVYLISGPLGVGKSTVSKTLASAMNQCVLIEGDLLLQVYRGETEPPWEERLRLAWLNIAAVTRNFLVNGLDVVIDFVVEDELQWFFDQLSDLDVTLHYVVLHAEPDTLNARLHQRGDTQYIDRSLFLRSKLMASPVNELFLLDTDGKKPDELAEEIIKNSRFRIHG